MSLASPLTALSSVKFLNCVSAANTAAATSAYVQVTNYEGDVAIMINTGIITGTITYTFSTATDSGGTGAAAVVPYGGALTQVTTSNDDTVAYIAVFDSRALKGFLQVIGTIVTGPALISYSLIGRHKTVLRDRIRLRPADVGPGRGWRTNHRRRLARVRHFH